MPLGTFARLTFGSRTFLARSLAGLIDYRYWGQDFTTSTPNSTFRFDQALHNMDPREFRDLLFTEALHEQAIKTVYSWSKGTFRPKTFKPMTFRGVRTLARRSRLESGSSVPGTLEKWRSAVADVLDRQQAQIRMEMLKPEGVMTMLLVAPNGSLLDYPNNTAYRAIHDILAILEDRFDSDRTKFLTTQTKANIAARDGYNAAEGDEGKHYAYTFFDLLETTGTNANSNANGRLIFGQIGLSTPGNPQFTVQDFGPDFQLGATNRLPVSTGTPEKLQVDLDPYPVGNRALFSIVDIEPRGNFYQRINLLHPTAGTLSGNFMLTYFRANAVRRTDPSGNTGKTVVDSRARFTADEIEGGGKFRLRHATTLSTQDIDDMTQFSLIDTVDSDTQLTLVDNGITGNNLFYVIEKVTDGSGHPSSAPYKLLDDRTDFVADGVQEGDYVLNVETRETVEITAVAQHELTLDSDAAHIDDSVPYVIGRTTGLINGGLPVSAAGGSQNHLLYAIHNALSSLPNAPPLNVYAVSAAKATSTEKEVYVYFCDPLKSGHIWPYAALETPTAARPPGYFMPEVSQEYSLLASLPASSDLNGDITIERVAENYSAGPVETLLYADFLSDQREALLDDTGASPAWRTFQSAKISNWRDWLYDYMASWWQEFKVEHEGEIDHIYNDNERVHSYSTVISGVRYAALLGSDGQVQAAKYLAKQPYFAANWAPRLGDDIVADLAAGTIYSSTGSSTDDSTVREQQRKVALFNCVSRTFTAEYMYKSVYESCAEHFPEVTAGGGWLDRLRSLSLIVGQGSTDPFNTLGSLHGTHHGVRLYSALDYVGEMDRHWYNLPPKAEDRTWSPQISAKIKHLKREPILDEFDAPTGMGLVTVEVFDENDVTSDPRYGNDQFLEGLKVGQLVRVRYSPANPPASVNDFAFLAFQPLTPLSMFAVTAVGHVADGEFEAGPDEDGNLVACQYIDTDRDDCDEFFPTANTLNRGIWLDTTTGWKNLVFNLSSVRSAFLASNLPISCWHSSEHSGYQQAQQRQYRAEVMFHALLHGEQHRYWYNSNVVGAGLLADAEILTNDALLEMGNACNLKATELSPLSLNYLRPSMQKADHVVSGANIRDDKRLFRVTINDEQLMALSGSTLVRIHPTPPIGPIATPSAEHADFRTISGRIVRVPGQRLLASDFEKYGWWVICEKS